MTAAGIGEGRDPSLPTAVLGNPFYDSHFTDKNIEARAQLLTTASASIAPACARCYDFSPRSTAAHKAHWSQILILRQGSG